MSYPGRLSSSFWSGASSADGGRVITRSGMTGDRLLRYQARRNTRVFGTSFSTSKPPAMSPYRVRSEEHTSELQSRPHLVCRLLLEKKNNNDPLLPSILEILPEHPPFYPEDDISDLPTLSFLSELIR